jgi:chorismate mutase/prephenate dehydratase
MMTCMGSPDDPEDETDGPLSAAGDPVARHRATIDRLDRDLIRLLAERLQAARAIGDHRSRNKDAALRDDDRERRLFEAWGREAEERGVSAYFAGRVLREILNWSRRDQERFLDASAPGPAGARSARVGYQGVPSCYSDLAIGKIFATRDVARLERVGFRGFAAVIDALESGAIDYALLPIENTIAGSINEVYDLLGHRPVTIVGEEVWEVEHCLLGLPGARLEDLRVVRSHPVALQQCGRFLDRLVGVTSESFHDTAGAAQAVAREGNTAVAAIAPEEAAIEYGLVVLKRDISDQPVNLTRFLLIGREAETFDARRPAKTSLVFSVNHRRGALLECLKCFDAQGINLTKLESRPQSNAPWEYQFYMDFEGHVSEPQAMAALQEMRAHTNHLKVLGSYPRRIETDRERQALDPARAGSASQGVAAAPATPRASEAGAAAPGSAAGGSAPAVPPHPALRLTGLKSGARRSRIDVSGVEFGGDRFVLAVGPCAVESRQQMLESAELVKRHGAAIMRGGAFKPRTSPYAFQGLGFPGLDLLVEAGRAYELPVVTEVLHPEDVERVGATADMLQVGARNMQNFALLKEMGRARRPVLLKRGLSATIEELLLAAEYVMSGGNHRVVLCERGIRTFETATRNTLDISAVPVLKERTHLPVIVDPSHAAGRRELVIPLALASAAAGADGLIIEAHPHPDDARCDKDQALTGEDLATLVAGLRPILTAQGRHL